MQDALAKLDKASIELVSTISSKDCANKKSYVSQKGRKTNLNGKIISVSDVKSIDQATINTGFPSGFNLNKQKIQSFIKQLLVFKKVRSIGSAAIMLAQVAEGICDVYFEKGWLDATLDIMNTYPKAGMVSAIPTIDKSIDHYENTLKGIKESKEIIITSGNSLIPDNYIEAHRLSLGKTVESYMANIKDRIDTKITLNGINAYVCAQDFQFTTRKEIITKVLPLVVTNKNIYYDPIYSPVFESKLDKLGFWRLSTEQYLIHHMGNSLKDLQEELALIRNRTEEKTNLIIENKTKPMPISIRIIKHPTIRKVLKKIYSSIYKLLYES